MVPERSILGAPWLPAGPQIAPKISQVDAFWHNFLKGPPLHFSDLLLERPQTPPGASLGRPRAPPSSICHAFWTRFTMKFEGILDVFRTYFCNKSHIYQLIKMINLSYLSIEYSYQLIKKGDVGEPHLPGDTINRSWEPHGSILCDFGVSFCRPKCLNRCSQFFVLDFGSILE